MEPIVLKSKSDRIRLGKVHLVYEENDVSLETTGYLQEKCASGELVMVDIGYGFSSCNCYVLSVKCVKSNSDLSEWHAWLEPIH